MVCECTRGQNIRPIKLSHITGAPKLINSDLFLEKRATVPIKTQGVQ